MARPGVVGVDGPCAARPSAPCSEGNAEHIAHIAPSLTGVAGAGASSLTPPPPPPPPLATSISSAAAVALTLASGSCSPHSAASVTTPRRCGAALRAGSSSRCSSCARRGVACTASCTNCLTPSYAQRRTSAAALCISASSSRCARARTSRSCPTAPGRHSVTNARTSGERACFSAGATISRSATHGAAPLGPEQTVTSRSHCCSSRRCDSVRRWRCTTAGCSSAKQASARAAKPGCMCRKRASMSRASSRTSSGGGSTPCRAPCSQRTPDASSRTCGSEQERRVENAQQRVGALRYCQ